MKTIIGVFLLLILNLFLATEGFCNEIGIHGTNNQNKTVNRRVVLDNTIPISKQISTENTVYEINRDFNLKGELIVVPKGCVLKIINGHLENGTIHGQETIIETSMTTCIFNLIEFQGSFNVNNTSVKWFGAKGDGEQADEDAIQMCLNFISKYNKEKLVWFPAGRYKVNSPLVMPSTVNITLKGFGGHQNRRGSTIVAGKRMNYLIGSSADSLNVTISDLSFDGSMNGKYYENGIFNFGNHSLAKHCFFFNGKYGATYSRFTNVYITGFSGEAIHGVSYGSRISNCQIKRCGYGIRCKTANNVSIIESELELIGNVAVLINGGSVNVRNCIFDVNGQGALVASSCQFNVENCYFEGCCKNGVIFKVGDSTIPGDYRFCIAAVHNASNINDGKNIWSLHRLYPVMGCSIKNNDIDWLSENENKYFVIASSMHNAEISNNRFRSDNFNAILGFPICKSAYCTIKNINISNNSPNGTEIKRVLPLNYSTTDLTSEGSVEYIYTDDLVSDIEYLNNLSNKLHIFGYNWNSNEQFVEQDLKYKGLRVLKNETNKEARLCIARQRMAQSGIIPPELLTNKTIQISTFRSNDGKAWKDATQVCHVSGNAENFLVTINVPAGQMITVPVVIVLGEPLINNVEWNPPFFSKTGNAPANIKLLNNSIVKSWGNASKYCSGQRITYKNGKQYLTMISLGTPVNKKEVEEFFGDKDYNGLWIMDEETKCIIYRLGNSWVDSFGNKVQ